MGGIRSNVQPDVKHMQLRKQTLVNFHEQENESIADLHTRFTLLLEKCNYNQCYMNSHKVDLVIHAVIFFLYLLTVKEATIDLEYNKLPLQSQEAQDYHC